MPRGTDELREAMSALLMEYMASTGLSQERLAEELRAMGYTVYQPTISSWINGKHPVTPASFHCMKLMLERVRRGLYRSRQSD